MDDSVTSATYGKLFPEQVADKCSPDALESNNGPLAYLHALYQQALTLEAKGDPESQLKLATRRPDIGERILDQASLDNEMPALTLVIEAMTQQAKTHAGERTNLAKAISESQYPSPLPFHYPFEQIKAILNHKKCSIFDFLQQSQYTFPNFTYGNLRTDELRQVMRMATGFSPALQSLLLDNSVTGGTNFLQMRYGVSGSASSVLEQLTSFEFFCRQTGLKPESALDLLATSGVPDDGKEALTTVRQSSAYMPAQAIGAPTMAGHLYGAVFINNATAPALSLEDTHSGPGISLRIKGATADHLGRIHKIIHLQHALQLPFAEVDLLIMAALRAEGQTKDFHLTENTLRALGVFCHMHSEYDVTAEQFAALIDGITPYTVGERSPFLDRVLDGPGAGQLANIGDQLVLDGRAFDPNTDTDNAGKNGVKSIVGAICRAFTLEERLANTYLTQVTQALGLAKPTLSLSVFSSLYRLSRLPRLLRLGMKEGTSLITLLANANLEVFQQLAGEPQISDNDKKPDILDVLIGLVNLETWLRRQKISAQALLNWLTPLPADIPAELKPLYRVDACIKQTLLNALPRITASLLSEAQIAQAIGSGVIPASGSWLSVLSAYLDSHGLVKSIPLPSVQSLADEIGSKLTSANPVRQVQVDTREVASKLDALINNAMIAQEDVAKHIISAAFSNEGDAMRLTTEHALPLLRWINETRLNLLADVLAARDALSTDTGTLLEGLSIELWSELARHAQVVKHLRLSATGLTALLDHPAWFDLEEEGTPPPPAPLTLDLYYQVSRYHDWIERCQRNGFEEADALDYFAMFPSSDQPNAVTEAAKRLGQLIDWHEKETILASPYVMVGTNNLNTNNAPKTFADYLSSLTVSELSYYTYCEKQTSRRGLGVLIFKYLHKQRANPNDPRSEIVYDKFKKFVEDNSGPILVTEAQYRYTMKPDIWKDITDKKAADTRTITLKSYAPSVTNIEIVYEQRTCIPNTISDIDFILRIQVLCEITGLSCKSMLDLSSCDEQSPFEDFDTSAQLLLGACSDEVLQKIEPRLQEAWRDALAAYLMGYWVPSNTALQAFISTVDDLSNYFLTDVLVSSAVKTNRVLQATASLQHYLHRLFARLDPGYTNTIIPDEESRFWRQYLNEYGSWKIWRTQLNHPENLIYYANRPNKSTAFQSLEVELNQGKLDTELLQTAITSYLTKFEQTSNLQIVSGYLDGVDPKNDTYHFIGKTNASPAEYYWRSVDMGLRDDKERLSPLAWTEWEKISVSATGQIVQSSDITPSTQSTYKCDVIRPVVIEGRPYVFWVERGTVGLPSADEKNQTPTKFKKISVQYIYKQSDGFWAPPNELLCLDGTHDDKRLPDENNPYLKDDTYQPGLIALVNIEGDRAKDPWLTVMLYNCAYAPAALTAEKDIEESVKYGNFKKDYFIEARDLLLIDNKQFPTEKETKKFSKIAYNSYSDIRTIQHLYTGDKTEIKKYRDKTGESAYALENYKENTLTTPNYDTTIHEQLVATLDTYGSTNLETNNLKKLLDEINNHYPLIKQSPFFVQPYMSHLSTRHPSDHLLFHPPVQEFVSKTINRENKSNIAWQQPGINFTPTNKKTQLHFPRDLPYNTINAAVDANNPKSLIINSHYKKTIINKTIKPTLTSITINKTVTAAGLLYIIALQASNVSLSISAPQTLTVEITSDGAVAPSIGYSVAMGGRYISKRTEKATAISANPGRWTYDLVIEKSEYLFEHGLVIEVFIGDTVIASLHPEIVINPKACEKIELRLYAKGPRETSFTRLTEESVIADGQAVITRDYLWTDVGQYTFALSEAGDPMQNVFTTFDVRMLGADEKWNISIKRNDQQAQYLDLSAAADQAPTFPSNAIRLNTLFGKKLVSRAARSAERALEWEAQLIQEPTIDTSIPMPPVDFHGANGAYFRELFLHLPDLVATRLSEQQQFDEAERWYMQYLFDPYRTQTDEKQRPPCGIHDRWPRWGPAPPNFKRL